MVTYPTNIRRGYEVWLISSGIVQASSNTINPVPVSRHFLAERQGKKARKRTNANERSIGDDQVYLGGDK
jgi:hypothetical protein